MSRPLAFAAAAAAGACVDFGYRADLEPAETGPDAGSDADAAAADAVDCAEAEAAPSDGPQLRLLTLAVDAPVLVVGAGDTVTWTNTDVTDRHDVAAGAPGAEIPPEDGGFRSRVLGFGERWAWRFCFPRTVFWFCLEHEDQMNGYRIVVQ